MGSFGPLPEISNVHFQETKKLNYYLTQHFHPPLLPQQQISLCIIRGKPTRIHRRTTLTGSTRYSSSLLETTAYSARSSEPIPLWTLRTRANTQHRDYAKYSICTSVSAAPLLRSLAIVGGRGGVLRGWCTSSGPRRRRLRSGEALVVTPARVRRHRAPSDGGDRWRPEAPSTRRAGCTRVLPPTRHFCTRASTLADGEAARVGHRSPKALHPYPMCAYHARLCTQVNQLRRSRLAR